MFSVCYILTQRMSMHIRDFFNDSVLYKCSLNNNNNNNNYYYYYYHKKLVPVPLLISSAWLLRANMTAFIGEFLLVSVV